MEVGQYKIIAIIQARLGSERLPNKVLMNLPATENGRPILDVIIDTASQCEYISETIVATSTNVINDKIESFCVAKKTVCYRGDEDNVLSRFGEITLKNKPDYIVRLTGDNPLIDAGYLSDFIKNHIEKALDYSCSKDLPLGCNFEMIKAGGIMAAYENAIKPNEKEHVTPYCKQNAKKQEVYCFGFDKEIRNIRLTVDYPSDYAMMNLLFDRNDITDTVDLKKIIEDLMKNKWMIDINKTNKQVS